MRHPILYSLVLALALAGCLPQSATPVSVDDLVATSISGTLAAEPTDVPPPPTEPPLTVETPATVPPTATTVPTLLLPTATLSATPSPTISPTAVTGDPRTALGQPTWRDPFDSGNGWNLGEDSFTGAKVEGGKFILTGLTTADGWRLTWPEVQDVYLESTIRTRTCTGNDEYGLMFRVPDIHDPDEGYLFGFTCDGRYFFRTWDGENMTALISATASSAIQAGSDKTNRIGVWAEGDEFTLYANGTLLGKIEDTMFPDEGGFGLFIGARQTEEFTTEADEIAYWDID
jgi:hypothetical protein